MKSAYEAVKAMKGNGRTVVGCFPLYPPLELLHSMGLTPVVLWGLRDETRSVPLSDRHLQAYTCSVGRSLTEFVLRHASKLLDGVFMYNACDTLRNLPEILQAGLAEQGCSLPLFRLHIPASPLGKAGDAEYFKARIRRLVRELEESFGVAFSTESFEKSVALYRKQRELSAALQGLVAEGRSSFGALCRIAVQGCFMPVEDHISLLELAVADARALKPGPELPRVMVSGILPPPPGIVDVIEAAGLRVADNDIAMLKRSYGRTPSIVNDPAEYCLDLYAGHYPCTTLLHTADARVEELTRAVREGGIRGFIFMGEKFCEYEYFEVPFLKKALAREGVRMLGLDFSLEDDERSGSYRTRIEGFAETLGQ